MCQMITDNIYSIYIELPDSPLKNLYAYLVKGEDRNLLIDTGVDNPICHEMLENALRELRVDMNQTDIFLTHFHHDHIGLVPHFATENTKVFMGWKDVARQLNVCQPYINQITRNELRLAGFPEHEINQSPLIMKDDYFDNPFVKYTAIDEGTQFHYGGYQFTAIAVPGHSPGQMCLYEKEHKILFAGDHVLFHITPNISRWSGVDDSLGDYIGSLLKIRDFEVDYLLPSHREVEGTLAERVDEIIEHHGVRVRETLDVLEQCPGISAYDIAGRMTWNIRHDGDWSQFPVAQKTFAVNEICAHLDYLVKRNRAMKKQIGVVEFYYPIRITKRASS